MNLFAILYEVFAIVSDTLHWMEQHRGEVTFFGLFLFVMSKVFERRIRAKLKGIFGHRYKSEIQEYVSNQKRIESKIDLLLKERDIQWDADDSIKCSNDSAATRRWPFTLPWPGPTTARTATRYTTLPIGRKRIMEKFKSRKFWVAIISAILVVLNEGLELGIDTNTVLAFAGIIMSYIFGQSHVDAKKVEQKQITTVKHPGDHGPAM